MASKRHQFILGLLVKKMRLEGYTVFYVEGKFVGSSHDGVTLPPRVIRHRPDAMGVSIMGQVAIADAKTASDVGNRRTEEQLVDYTSTELNGLCCEVFVGVPSSAEARMRKVLRKLALDGNPRFHLLSMPDEIINE